MDRRRLEQLAHDFSLAPADEYEALSDLCRDLAINELDVRFMLLKECFEIASSFWGEGEGGAVSASFVRALRDLWETYLPNVLSAQSEEEGTTLASALREELIALGAQDPLTFRRDIDD